MVMILKEERAMFTRTLGFVGVRNWETTRCGVDGGRGGPVAVRLVGRSVRGKVGSERAIGSFSCLRHDDGLDVYADLDGDADGADGADGADDVDEVLRATSQVFEQTNRTVDDFPASEARAYVYSLSTPLSTNLWFSSESIMESSRYHLPIIGFPGTPMTRSIRRRAGKEANQLHTLFDLGLAPIDTAWVKRPKTVPTRTSSTQS
jgi:hypothetical protein